MKIQGQHDTFETGQGQGLVRKRSSIASLVIFVILTITLCLLSTAGVVGYIWFRHQEITELKVLTSILTQQACKGLSLPMWNFDNRQIYEAAEGILEVPSVYAVAIRDAKSRRIILALERDSIGSPRRVDRVFAPSGALSGEGVILFDDEIVGTVQVMVSPSLLEARLEKVRLAIYLFVLSVASITTAALFLTLRKIVILPIAKLQQFAMLTPGEVGVGSRFGNFRSYGEVASLQASIASMLALLESRLAVQQQDALRVRESENRFRTLVDTIPDLIWLKDTQGVYLSCNRMFERFFGASEAEIVGKTDDHYVEREQAESFRRCDRQAIEAGKPTLNEEWVAFADGGQRVYLEVIKTPMFGADGNLIGVLGIGRDITKRQQAEDAQRELDERMNNIQKLEALGVLVAGVAHNLNNVLAAIMGTASMREPLAADSADREAFEIIVTACKRGRDVVKSLMQFSRPTLSNQAPVELRGLLSEVRVLLENTMRNRIEIIENFCTQPLWIHGDAGSISNCFMNLCINAIDAMPQGGRITLWASVPEPNWIEVRVVDTGTGISPEILTRVIEPFFTTKAVGSGTGLGLSMTHGVIKAHGGSLDIASTPGEGTIVKVRLPKSGPPVSETHVDAKGALAPLRVLLVDDDADIRFLVARILKISGHVVEAVAGGREALDRLEVAKFDLVIMDQNMPGMDGVHTMLEMRVHHPRLPILISSGQPDIQEWECFRQPFVAVLSKPFDVAELTAKLDQFAKS